MATTLGTTSRQLYDAALAWVAHPDAVQLTCGLHCTHPPLVPQCDEHTGGVLTFNCPDEDCPYTEVVLEGDALATRLLDGPEAQLWRLTPRGVRYRFNRVTAFWEVCVADIGRWAPSALLLLCDEARGCTMLGTYGFTPGVALEWQPAARPSIREDLRQ